jgi:hypothetical protein
MVFGLGAVAVVFCWPYRWRYKRWAKALCAAPLAALATMSSPGGRTVRGLVAVALFLQKRRPGAWALGLAPAAVVAVSAWLFPFSGTQPMLFGSMILPLASGVIVYFLVPREWKTVRITAAVYSIGVLLVWLVSSQIGSNISRLAMLFAGVALIAALPFAVPRSRKWYAIVAGLRRLQRLDRLQVGRRRRQHRPGRVLVARTRPARQRAPDGRRRARPRRGRPGPLPHRGLRPRARTSTSPAAGTARPTWSATPSSTTTPSTPRTTTSGCSAGPSTTSSLPKDKPDGDGGERERELVQRGMPYLKQVWGDANWQLFQVTDPTPLAEPPRSSTGPSRAS